MTRARKNVGRITFVGSGPGDPGLLTEHAAAALRTAGVIPDAVALPLREVARWLTVGAMASLGLGVELGAVRRAGPRVVLAVTGSLALLLAGSVWLARTVPLG